MHAVSVGVLAFQGDVLEHVQALEDGARKLKKDIKITLVRTKKNLEGLDALVIPGGESTTIWKLCEREQMFEPIKRIKNLFGTCAGAILLAKRVEQKAEGQKTLAVMDIGVDRNAYGRQASSFEEDIDTAFGRMHAVFIRAPRITSIGRRVAVLARKGDEILACEEKRGGAYYLASAFHPELTTSAFHEHFLRNAR